MRMRIEYVDRVAQIRWCAIWRHRSLSAGGTALQVPLECVHDERSKCNIPGPKRSTTGASRDETSLGVAEQHGSVESMVVMEERRTGTSHMQGVFTDADPSIPFVGSNQKLRR